jgi:hypothetical protein
MRLPNNPWTFISIAIVVSFYSCASPKPLSGGPKDIAPPDLIENESTPNRQTSFREKEIILTFNEWIELKDVNAQLVISPLMPKKPEVKQKGKSMIITLPDSLKPNTTYTMNFGSGIQDLNEGNKLENFSFIFSTGTFLDSIQLNGKVTDAATLKPGAEVWVMLYPPGHDSIVYKQQPEYLAKANKEGMWSISNVRNDSFLVVALKDENLNFVYDQDNELFGWLDHIQYSNVSATLPELKVSARDKKAIILDVNQVAPGYMVMYIPGPKPKLLPTFQPALEQPTYEWFGDSLFIWYAKDLNYDGKVILGTDTTRIRAADTKYLQNKPLLLSSLTVRMHPGDNATMKSSVPIQRIDPSLIQLSKDTTDNIPFEVERDSLSSRIVLIKSVWVPASRYVIHFLPGAIIDIWERSNDTFNSSFVVNAIDQFSNLALMVTGLDSTYSYVVQIMTGTNIERSYTIHHQSSAMISSKGMQPGKFTIELIEDRNENGAWDTGNFDHRYQPERKMVFVPDNLRAGWDVELKMEWKDE